MADQTSRLLADDAALIERSWRDPGRFAELFDRHAPAVHRYLARRLGEQVAADVLAETFLAAFRRREAYDTSRGDARPWLYGIATNLVGQHRRDEARRHRLLRAVGPEPAADFPADGVADRVSAAAARRVLADALATLAPPDRDVLLLVATEQLTYDEVGAPGRPGLPQHADPRARRDGRRGGGPVHRGRRVRAHPAHHQGRDAGVPPGGQPRHQPDREEGPLHRVRGLGAAGVPRRPLRGAGGGAGGRRAALALRA